MESNKLYLAIFASQCVMGFVLRSCLDFIFRVAPTFWVGPVATPNTLESAGTGKLRTYSALVLHSIIINQNVVSVKKM